MQYETRTGARTANDHDPTRIQTVRSCDSEIDDQQIIMFKCDEINKRSLGRAIIKFCGNEGAYNDDNKKALRRLVQAVISYVESENPDIWRDAEIKIYDDNFDIYSIRAGDGSHLFLATFDGSGNPQVVKTKRSKIEGVKNKNCVVM